MLTTTIRRLAPRGAPDETAFLPVASITVADDGTVTLRGNLAALPLGKAITDPKTRESVTLDQDPERWARLLTWALRSPELQVAVEADTTGPLDTSADASPVAALRRHLGLTARQAATEIGVSQPALTNTEKRGAGVALDTFDRYVTALGATMSLQLTTPTARLQWTPRGSHDALLEHLQRVGLDAEARPRSFGGGNVELAALTALANGADIEETDGKTGATHKREAQDTRK